MTDAEFAAIVRRALLMVVRAIEGKYPEVACADPHKAAVRRTGFVERPVTERIDRTHSS
jgi:hypothetical protein